MIAGLFVMVVCLGVLLVGWAVKHWVDHSEPSKKDLKRLYGKGGELDPKRDQRTT